MNQPTTIALPANWECCHGPADDEPFCAEAEDDSHVCPTIRVHPDDAEQFAGLVDEAHRLRVERDEFCNRVDTLTAVAKGNKRHVQEMFLELQKAQAAMEEIRHLHKDSPMGPCPVCIDADALAEGRDGLVAYPCPTGRLAGAQDCNPPAPAAAGSAAANADGQQ